MASFPSSPSSALFHLEGDPSVPGLALQQRLLARVHGVAAAKLDPLPSSRHRSRMGSLIVGGSEALQEAGGAMRVERLATRVLRYTGEGYGSTALATFALAHSQQLLDEIGDGLCCLYDWWGMSGYSSQARADATAFVLKHRARYRTTIFLTSSALVSMGVNVANVVLGGFLQGTTSREVFDRRVAEVLAEESPAKR